MSSPHQVRHLLNAGDYIKTEFRCTAEEGAFCRMSCERCREHEMCICEASWTDPPVEPDMRDQGECLMLLWVKEDPEESFGGGDESGVEEIRGPGWQPIDVTWNGDYCEWSYAS